MNPVRRRRRSPRTRTTRWSDNRSVWAAENELGFVDVVASFPADPQSAEAVQPGDRALDHVTEDAQARAVFLASSQGFVVVD